MDGITTITTEASFAETAASAPPGARVPVELRVTVDDPYAAYRRARTEESEGVYLETTGGQAGWGYFAVDPVEQLQVGAEATARDGDSPTMAAIDGLLNR